MLPEIQKQISQQFYESSARNEILRSKKTIMIQLPAIGCYPKTDCHEYAGMKNNIAIQKGYIKYGT